jgi:hypothetical protein
VPAGVILTVGIVVGWFVVAALLAVLIGKAISGGRFDDDDDRPA